MKLIIAGTAKTFIPFLYEKNQLPQNFIKYSNNIRDKTNIFSRFGINFVSLHSSFLEALKFIIWGRPVLTASRGDK